MRYLLDTHTFLWFINDSLELNANAKILIESESRILLSIASLWEIAIKNSLGKLTLPDTYDKFIPEQLGINDIDILPISLEHLSILNTLVFHHKDPFDRLLIAQAIVEKVSVISKDKAFDSYPVTRIWE